MTISISGSANDELFKEMESLESSRHLDPQDMQDFMGNFPPVMGRGYWRTICLRDGLEVTLGNLQMHDRVLTTEIERVTECIELHLHLSGVHGSDHTEIGPRQYGLYGCGLSPKRPLDVSSQQPFLEVVVGIRADVLCSFIADSEGELPQSLKSWVRTREEKNYLKFSKASPAMQLVARQMLQCGLQGLPKRMFLEGKSLELLSLVAAEEMYKGGTQTYLPKDLIDRLHYARDILRQRLDNPPNLGELARLVGLNDCTLKQGFRQVFDTTVFSYLHNYRMEQAKQALNLGDWTVGEVARMVGYTNLSAFSRAFSKRFEINPRDYLRKNSV